MATSNPFRKTTIHREALKQTPAVALRRRRVLPKSTGWFSLSRVSDVLAALIALLIAVRFRILFVSHVDRLYDRQSITELEAICFGCFGLALFCLGREAEVDRADPPFWMELSRAVGTCLVAGLLVSGVLYLLQITSISPLAIVSLVCLTSILTGTNRIVGRLLRSHRRSKLLDARHVLVIGTNRMSEALRRQMAMNCSRQREFIGFVRPARRFLTDEVDPEHIVGGLHQLRTICRLSFVDEIIVAEDCPIATIMEVVDQAREIGVDVFALPGVHDDSSQDRCCERVGDFALIPLHVELGSPLGRAAKRTCDLMFSLAGLVAISPLLLVISIAIHLDSPGPVLYISERLGRKGRPFRCLKFRTMCVGAEAMKAQLMERNERDGVLFKMTNDPRITRVGRILRKYSLDELPQIVNVIRGEMSLVGPRPPIASEVENYEVDHYRRLEATPGLTGAWQVTARHDPSFETYVAIDIDYVKNWSFWLDMAILLKTAAVVCRGTGS